MLKNRKIVYFYDESRHETMIVGFIKGKVNEADLEALDIDVKLIPLIKKEFINLQIKLRNICLRYFQEDKEANFLMRFIKSDNRFCENCLDNTLQYLSENYLWYCMTCEEYIDNELSPLKRVDILFCTNCKADEKHNLDSDDIYTCQHCGKMTLAG